MNKTMPAKGEWTIAKMDVKAEGKVITFLVGAAPIASVLYNGKDLQVRLDENQATFFALQFPTDEITTVAEFLEKLKSMHMAIEDRTNKLIVANA